MWKAVATISHSKWRWGPDCTHQRFDLDLMGHFKGRMGRMHRQSAHKKEVWSMPWLAALLTWFS